MRCATGASFARQTKREFAECLYSDWNDTRCFLYIATNTSPAAPAPGCRRHHRSNSLLAGDTAGVVEDDAPGEGAALPAPSVAGLDRESTSLIFFTPPPVPGNFDVDAVGATSPAAAPAVPSAGGASTDSDFRFRRPSSSRPCRILTCAYFSSCSLR